MSFSNLVQTPWPSNQEWAIFPNEYEGRSQVLIHSLISDGVTPNGNVYLNYALSKKDVLLKLLGIKSNSKIELNVSVSGEYKIEEAGENISHEEFEELFKGTEAYLQAGEKSLYIEDGGLCTSSSSRVGLRVVSDDPSILLIARSLMV